MAELRSRSRSAKGFVLLLVAAALLAPPASRAFLPSPSAVREAASARSSLALPTTLGAVAAWGPALAVHAATQVVVMDQEQELPSAESQALFAWFADPNNEIYWLPVLILVASGFVGFVIVMIG
mmetsp:Transcript_3019/g.6433  ORF Transcript_3019/g.6433 Transcript_3019/m.6433 type:complete len:124 (+) Transcript_3019:3-374(+)